MQSAATERFKRDLQQVTKREWLMSLCTLWGKVCVSELWRNGYTWSGVCCDTEGHN